MKLFDQYCDIAILTADEAWENYCNALHIALVARGWSSRRLYHDIAHASLDRHFKVIERDLEKHIKRGSPCLWKIASAKH